MGWFPCCCLEERFVSECSICENDEAPPWVCVRFEGVAEFSPTSFCHGVCEDHYNDRTVWLQIDELDHNLFVLGGPFIFPDEIITPSDAQCYWRCIGPQLCASPRGSSSETFELLLYESSDGNTYLQFFINGGPGYRIDLGVSPASPACTEWDELEIPFFQDHIGGLCDHSGATVYVTAKTSEVPDNICCRTESAGCFVGTVPFVAQLEIEGVVDCGGSCMGGGDRNCEDINGTYLFEIGGTFPFNPCGFRIDIDPDLACGFQRLGFSFGIEFGVEFSGYPISGTNRASFIIPQDPQDCQQVIENFGKTQAVFAGCELSIDTLSGPGVCGGSLGADNQSIKFTYTPTVIEPCP